MKYHDPEFCKCGKEITETNQPQKYDIEFHVEGGVKKKSYVISGCNVCLKIPFKDE